MNSNQTSLLYFCDFPPSGFAGGPILIKRLLADYPPEKLTVFTGSHYAKSAPQEERLNCAHIIFPTTSATGRFGLGRLKYLADWMLMPLLVISGILQIKRRGAKVILTVAHGHFFLAATCVSTITSTPLVLIVHDDWVDMQKRNSYLFGHFSKFIFRFAARRAAHIYAVSPSMQKLLKSEFNVESELQLPSTEPNEKPAALQSESAHNKRTCILYAGIGSGAVLEGLDLMVRTITSGHLSKLGLDSYEFHLYISASEEMVKNLGWDHEAIKVKGWVSQPELRSALAAANILFLPYSFSEEEKKVTIRSFPSKAADYLASGTPMLILSPRYSSIVEYASQYGFAEIVDTPSVEALAKAILRLSSDSAYRELLAVNATKTFNLNHNIIFQQSTPTGDE